MNGFASHDLDEAAFGEKDSLTGVLRTFDAFRKSLILFPLLSCPGSTQKREIRKK